MDDERMTKSETTSLETPKFNYDLNFDLKILQKVLKSADFLQDSGYKSASVLNESSLVKSIIEKPAPPPACLNYGTGWMIADNLSDDGSMESEENFEFVGQYESEPCSSYDLERKIILDKDEDLEEEDLFLTKQEMEKFRLFTQDGLMEVSGQKIKIKDMTDILVTRFAFISGLRTRDGHPVMTFPDSRSIIDFEQYQLLVGYLLQVPPLEDQNSAKKGYVIIVDRRLDKWSSVRLLFTYLTNYFPEPIRVVFLLKPEGVLQRALEVGYRNFAENGKFKVVLCQSSVELRHFIGGDCLTMDVGGDLKYNHLEWVQHRMDIERMKSSAAVIAESLSEFGRCLRETELPNDVETTERILEAQTSEHDAIKEDFRISIRKGLSLLRQVRQLEQKPDSELLSPTRLHNVTAIERMLVQLEDTERSFDAFWQRHRQRLTNCLQLRRFEESFRKIFLRHSL
uniref:CRAL-TRIO domain-containing protein n=1 Tax=Panagrolaimus sp. JU765 TaxID=591449 RepID=A0AC34QRH7_9BILA